MTIVYETIQTMIQNILETDEFISSDQDLFEIGLSSMKFIDL